MNFRPIASLTACLLLLLACSKEPEAPVTPVPPPVPQKKMNIPDTAVLLVPGLKQQLAAFFPFGADSSSSPVWSSSDPGIVQVNGLGTITGLKAGKAFVIASHPRNQVASDSIPVYVLTDQQIHLVGTGSTDRWMGIAFYWRNGVATQLAGTLMEVGAQASAVTLYKGDVYIAGTTINASFWDMATYWKNGVPVIVSDPTVSYNYWVHDILVNADGIHIAGFDYRDYGCNPNCYPGNKGHYWKAQNGQVTAVPVYDPTNDSISTNLYAIAQQGNDIVLAGNQVEYRYYGLAGYWRNDFAHGEKLTRDSWGMVQDILAVGSGLVMGGFDGCPWTNCFRKATVWDNRDGRTFTLTDGTHEAEVTGLAMDGNRIVAVGYEDDARAESMAACWVIDGNQVRRIPLSGAGPGSMVHAIAVKDGEYFLAGFSRHETGNMIATLWRVFNNMSIALPQYSPSPWRGSSNFSDLYVE